MTDLMKVATYDECSIQAMKFPQKLWKIVNDCKTGAIQWNRNGSSVLLEYKQFQDEYLTPNTSIFKTTNITSFIRQLNLYGFRKVTSHHRDVACNSHNPDMHEFLHENFRADRADLLSKVCRKMNAKTKRVQKQKQNSIFNNIKENDFPDKGHGMTRLQKCQFALRKALEQASRQYKQDKIVRLTKETENLPSADGDNSKDTVLTVFEIDAPEESQGKSFSESEIIQDSNEDVLYQVPDDDYQILVPIEESSPRFHPYFFSRNL